MRRAAAKRLGVSEATVDGERYRDMMLAAAKTILSPLKTRQPPSGQDSEKMSFFF